MQAPPIQPQILHTIPAVDLYTVHLGERKFITRSPLAFLHLDGKHYLQVADIRWRIGVELASLKCAPNTYIFAVDGQPDLFYSIIVLPDTPVANLNQFQYLVSTTTSFQDSTAPPAAANGPPAGPAGPSAPSPTAHMVAEGVVKAGQALGTGLMVAAGLTAHGIQKGTELALSKASPVTDPEAARARLNKAAAVMGTVATGTRAAADTVMSIAGAAAKMMAQHLEKTEVAKKLSTNSNVQLLSAAAGQAAKDVGQAWMAAAQIVSTTGKAAGQHFVQQRYGVPSAGTPSTSGGAPPQPNPYPQPPPATNPYPEAPTGNPFAGLAQNPYPPAPSADNPFPQVPPAGLNPYPQAPPGGNPYPAAPPAANPLYSGPPAQGPGAYPAVPQAPGAPPQ